MIKVLVLACSMCLTLGAQAAQHNPSVKHKNVPCATCHTSGEGSAVSYETCKGCHSVSRFAKEVFLKNGKPNPHVTIHYDPEMVDCTFCHRQHQPSLNYCEACHSGGFNFIVP